MYFSALLTAEQKFELLSNKISPNVIFNKQKKKKIADHNKGGVATTFWVDHCLGSYSLMFYIEFVSNY